MSMHGHELLVVGVLCWGTLGLVVHAHATSHGRNGPFWFALSLFAGPFGVAAYALAVLAGTEDADPVEVEDPAPAGE